MHRFEVWAPTPTAVGVVVDGVRYPMEQRAGGWWRAEVPQARPGSRYGFSLDGGEPRPDPRSMHQPDGVHGLSAVVDHDAFAWSDAAWRGVPLAGAVLYELHVGTFSDGGTFEGVIEHLSHVVDLGIDAIELLPVAEFPGDRGWGYDGVDLFAPHHRYGGPEGLKRLVDACHRHGLGCVMDVVYNHLGPSGNYLPAFGPYFTERHHTPWGEAVNFDDVGADEVRRFVVDNALLWLRDYHCDGLRLDAVHAIVDPTPTHVLEQVGVAVEALAVQQGRPLFVIAENDTNDPRIVRPREAGGYGLDAAWADEWHHAVHVALTGEGDGYYQDFVDVGESLPTALRHAWVHHGDWSASRGRAQGRSPAGLAPSRFVVCTQNHDQVGNRATGERTAALVSPGRLEIAAALLLTTPFVPMLFAGEEWAASTPFQYFTDHGEPELADAVREGRRAEFSSFGWAPEDVPDPQDPATFDRSRLDWSELDRPAHRRLLEWHRTLLACRRRVAAITDPGVPTEVTWEDGLLVVRRGPVFLAANLSPQEHCVEVDEGAEVLAASPETQVGVGSTALPVDTVVLWHRPAD
ncbi:MAG: malto-oligosyltrehalose trehalohydrolase [Acidimicrobiales bacterium]|nr:malto-oligosyltrehalose trehalohydrolase [Acidimicrobiales bacterium]